MTTMRLVGSGAWRLLPAAVVLVTAACGSRVAGPPAAHGSATTRPAAATGVIFGVVRAGPTCPIDRAYHACRPRPLDYVELRARLARTGLISTGRTSTDGHFSVRLRPGKYVLTVVTTAVFPRCPPVRVSARSGAAVRANITCDTGIRLPERVASNSGWSAGRPSSPSRPLRAGQRRSTAFTRPV